MIKLQGPNPKFHDIPKFASGSCHWAVDVSWEFLETQLEQFSDYPGLILEPDFQRAHVWTWDQQSRYIEHVLRRGRSGKDIWFNCPTWHRGSERTPIVLVDGLQRITAVREFMASRVPAFGYLRNQFKGHISGLVGSLRFHMNELQTRAEVLQWYLEINDGGVVHSREELYRVQVLLDVEVEAAVIGVQ